MSASWAAGSSSAWRRVRRLVLERDGYRCQIDGCGAYATHVDHVLARCRGGAHLDPANLRAACARCNLSRGDGTRASKSKSTSSSRIGWTW